MGDTNSAIKVRDRDSGLIVAKILVECKALSQWGMGSMDLHFTLTINTKQGKVRLQFQDLVNYYNGSPNPWDYAKVDTQEKLDKTYNECLHPVVVDITKALDKSDDF